MGAQDWSLLLLLLLQHPHLRLLRYCQCGYADRRIYAGGDGGGGVREVVGVVLQYLHTC